MTVRPAALVLVLFAAGCAARLPVVTAPAYPDYLFPAVPDEWTGSDAARLHGEAWTFLQAGDLPVAERRYRALLASSPAFYPAETGLGWLDLARGRARRAAEHFDRAVAVAAAYAPAWVGRGESLLALDDTEEALRSFEQALVADAGLAQVERTVGELRFRLVSERLARARDRAAARRFDEARGLYEQVLAASPDSAFLHVELGRVELGQGDYARAQAHAREAIALDPSDPAAFVLQGELHEAVGELAAAQAAFGRAYSLDPTEETSRRLDRLRERQLPAAVRALPSRPEVTRGELAALIGTRFRDLLRTAAAGRTVIVTDTRDFWGHAWVLDVTQAGVMQVDAAYRFEPARTVRRAELAEVVGAMLDLAAAADSPTTSRRAAPRPEFSDMPPGHLGYPAAARAVAAGVLDVLDGGTFRPTRPVAGREALQAVERLAALASARR